MATIFPPSARSDLLRMKSDLAFVRLEIKFRRLLRAMKYDPDQLRAPAGNSDGGQWTRENNAGGSSDNITVPKSSAASMSKLAECEAQWKLDIIRCNIAAVRACYAQAMVRLVACERGHSIPPLNY